MEVTISFSSILQIISLVFTIGGIGAWVRYKIQELTVHYEKLVKEVDKLHDQCAEVKSSIKDVRNESITREDAFDKFVAKEVMIIQMKSIEGNITDIKNMLTKLEGKRSTD